MCERRLGWSDTPDLGHFGGSGQTANSSAWDTAETSARDTPVVSGQLRRSWESPTQTPLFARVWGRWNITRKWREIVSHIEVVWQCWFWSVWLTLWSTSGTRTPGWSCDVNGVWRNNGDKDSTRDRDMETGSHISLIKVVLLIGGQCDWHHDQRTEQGHLGGDSEVDVGSVWMDGLSVTDNMINELNQDTLQVMMRLTRREIVTRIMKTEIAEIAGIDVIQKCELMGSVIDTTTRLLNNNIEGNRKQTNWVAQFDLYLLFVCGRGHPVLSVVLAVDVVCFALCWKTRGQCRATNQVNTWSSQGTSWSQRFIREAQGARHFPGLVRPKDSDCYHASWQDLYV